MTNQPTPRLPDPLQVARLIRTWVAGYRDDGTPIHEAEAQTDTGRFVTARLIGAQWRIQTWLTTSPSVSPSTVSPTIRRGG